MGEIVTSSRSQPTSQPTQVSVLSERAKLVNRLAVAAIALAGGLGVAIVAGAISFTLRVALPVAVLLLAGLVGLVYVACVRGKDNALKQAQNQLQVNLARINQGAEYYETIKSKKGELSKLDIELIKSYDDAINKAKIFASDLQGKTLNSLRDVNEKLAESEMHISQIKHKISALRDMISSPDSSED